MKRITDKMLWTAYEKAAVWGNKTFGLNNWRRENAPKHVLPMFRRAVRELLKLAK